MRRDKEFTKLQKHWYKTLKLDGFKDIESTLDDGSHGAFLSHSHSSLYKRHISHYQNVLDYYMLASQFYHDHPFDTDLEKGIWLQHAEGKPYRVIATDLNTYTYKVFKTIKKLTDGAFKSYCLKEEVYAD